jgi:NAD-dependent dihydropyrimidine dehydrogenase PreA subunit
MVGEEWLPEIDSARCTGCGDCLLVCPTRALALVGGTAVVAAPDACDYSAACEAICPVDAIALPYQVVLDSERPRL